MTDQAEDIRKRFESLVEINQLLMSTLEPEALIHVILDSAKRLFSAEACSIAVIDESADHLAFVFSVGGTEVLSFRMEMGQGIVGWVAQNGESVICRDVSGDPRFFKGVDNQTGFQTRSLLCAPLRQRGRIIGAIEVLNMARPADITRDDLRLLEVFGALASTAIDRAKLFARTSNANVAYREQIQDRYHFVSGRSKAMSEVIRIARTAASANSTILLTGQSGTGKEILARSIHQWSPRADHPFIAVNCVALSPELMESELFGHEKGAFTGAIARKNGRFELAEGGTVFLDEIGELTPRLQTKLLRVIQEKEFQRVGGTTDIRANVRIIAATNRDLQAAIRTGEFREDLFYRLNVVSITMPLLRDRKEDIPALVAHFVTRYCGEMKRPTMRIEDSAMDRLTEYSWRGNIRELQNVIERTIVMSQGPVITLDDFPLEIRSPESTPPVAAPPYPAGLENLPLAEAVDQLKRTLIRKALDRANGSQAEAAHALGLQGSNLSRLMKSLGLR